MSTIILDTHPLVYYLLQPDKLPKKALGIIADDAVSCGVPLISILEIEYLIEIKRIKANISDIISFLHADASFYFQAYDEPVMLASLDIKGHRDPFDRIIFSTAIAYKLPIITKDKWMRSFYKKCVWDK